MRDVSRHKSMDVLQSKPASRSSAITFGGSGLIEAPHFFRGPHPLGAVTRGMSCRSPYRRALRLPSGGLVRMEQLPLDPRFLAGRVLNTPANVGGSYHLHNVLST
jgi:hypothetical protein